MYVKVKTPFHGVEEGRLLRTGDVIQVSRGRGERMVARKLAVETSEPAKPKPKAKKRRRKKRSKKASKPSKDKAQKPTEDKSHLTEGVAAPEEESEVSKEG